MLDTPVIPGELVGETTTTLHGKTVPLYIYKAQKKAMPARALDHGRDAYYRDPHTKPNSRTSPVRVVTSAGDTLLFKSHFAAWRALRLPDTKMIRQRIACAFSGEAKITHGGTEYTFSFVELY